MTSIAKKQATSTELTSGAGFTYEDTVVAYYLAALLREEHAAGQSGIVTSVAVQQAQVNPMDDVIVEFSEDGTRRMLSLQVKRQLRITSAASNTNFREIMAAAVATRRMAEFQVDADAYGFAAENVAVESLRSLKRLIEWAKSSPNDDSFTLRFEKGGSAAAAERSLRQELAPLIDAQSPDDERKFYAQFVALKFDGLVDGGIMRTEVINRLQELIAVNEAGQDLLLFDRLCRIARDGAASGRKWTRQALLAQLRGAVRLKVAPNCQQDIDLLQVLSADGLADVSEEIAGIRVERPILEQSIRDRLTQYRLVSLSGLPGCGKSAMLKRIASVDATNGPILFLKSDRLEGSGWLTFALHSASITAELRTFWPRLAVLERRFSSSTGSIVLGRIRRVSSLTFCEQLKPTISLLIGRCWLVRAIRGWRPIARGFRRVSTGERASAMFRSGGSRTRKPRLSLRKSQT